MNDSKRCIKCQELKSIDNFYFKCFYKNTKYYASYCIPCSNADCKERREKTRDSPKVKISEKRCPKCQQLLPVGKFDINNSIPDGYNPCCRQCRKKTRRIRLKQIEKLPKHRIEGKVCPGCNQYKLCTNYGKYKGRVDGLSRLCKECVHLIYIKTKPQRVIRDRERRATDPLFKLIKNIRGRIRAAIRTQSKFAHTKELLGCTGEECMAYLEKLFWPGMTRNNMGNRGWVVDHVIPVDSFDKTDPNWQFKAFHYTNLQPLWRDDNTSKGDRLNWDPRKSKHELPERLKNQ